ncbi:MAG: leucine-rich repeat domain-containing protein [Acutalibacteraceae bacterium]
MNRRISEFYEKLFKNPVIKKNLELKMKDIKTEDELKKLIKEEIIPFVQKNGENFTVDDLVDFEKESISKIPLKDLEGFSGGVSWKPLVMGAGLSMLSIFGLKINTADAAIPFDVITESTDAEQQGTVADATQEQTAEQKEPAADATQEQTTGQKETVADATQEQTAEQKEPAADATQEQTTEQEEPAADATQEQAKKITTDEEYIRNALDPKDALIMNLSGTTERFRFMNGDIGQIEVGEAGGDGVPRLDFKKYAGEGSANLMTSLFPSSTGELSTEGGFSKNHPLSKNCNPDPELMASIVAYLHNHVRTTDEKISAEMLDNNFNHLRKLEDLDKKKFEKPNDGKVYAFFKNKLKLDFSSLEDLYRNQDKLNTLKFLLRNAQYMIENQEQNAKKTNRILPQYTTERMLMCYFLNHFNTKEELGRFFKAAREKIIGETEVASENLKSFPNNLDRGEMTKKILSKVKMNKDCPYKSQLTENGSAKKVVGNKFTSYTFQDCADTAIRHLVNLMGYNGENEWGFFLSDAQEKDLNNNMDNIRKAIDGNGDVKPESLKDRFQAFIAYQRKVGANDSSITTRSFWNAVVSNMNKNAGDDLFQVKYVQKNGNEVDTGYINMLKVTYNLLKSLGKINNEDLKNSINALNEKTNGTELQKVIGKLLNIFDAKAKVGELKNFVSKNGEIYGEIEVSTKGKTFTISQEKGHACIEFNPIKLEKLAGDEKDFIAKDQIGQLLANRFNVDHEGTVSFFNSLYGNVKIKNEFTEIPKELGQHYANFHAMEFLKTFQGEGNNLDRIARGINKECLNSNVEVCRKKEEKTTAGKFIFENYASKSDVVLSNRRDIFYNFAQSNGYIVENENDEYICVPREDKISIFPTKANQKVVIPSTINFGGKDYTVSEINCCMIDEPQNIETVEFADGFKSETLTIGENAFNWCINLTNFTIPDKVKELTIGDTAFRDCKSLEAFKIPDSVKELTIGYAAFGGCTKLADFTIPEGVEKLNIGENAFSECTKLTNFTIPDKVKELNIGENAFNWCINLTNFTIPGSVKELTIDRCAFCVCVSLEAFKISGSVKELTIGEHAFWNCNKLTNFTIPDKVKELTIDKYAFRDCKSLEAFKIPGSVKELTINAGAFYNCNKLTNFTIPGSVKELTIDDAAFGGCTKLADFTIPGSVEKLTIDEASFDGCNNLTNFTISGSVKELTIDRQVSRSCKNLEAFTVPEGVEKLTIGGWAFSICKSLENFTIPDSVKELTIGGNAFMLCAKLTNFTIPEGVEKLNIGRNAFWKCTNLTNFTIPGSVKELTIDDWAFKDCSSLEAFKIPKSVEKLTIGRNAFGNCINLTNFTIPDRIKELTIDEQAF